MKAGKQPLFWNLPVCKDDREQQIPGWAMLMKPFPTARKQGKVAEMTVKNFLDAVIHHFVLKALNMAR